MKYWLPPTKEFLPATGCKRTEVIDTPYMTPYRKWDCPSNGLGAFDPTLIPGVIGLTPEQQSKLNVFQWVARTHGGLIPTAEAVAAKWPYYVAGLLGVAGVGLVGYTVIKKRKRRKKKGGK